MQQLKIFTKVMQVSLLMVLLPFVTMAADDLFHWSWQARFDAGAGWTAKPTWLSGASDHATLTYDGVIAEFRVPEAGHGMKWHLPITPSVLVPLAPWLIIKYQADPTFDTGGSDYFIYLDDCKSGYRAALKRRDLKADGLWHEVAVRIDKIMLSPTLRGIALQVRANRNAGAAVRIAHLYLSEYSLEEIAGEQALPVKPKVWQAALPNPDFTGYRALDLAEGEASCNTVMQHLRGPTLPVWSGARIAGVPFRLPTMEQRLPVAGILQTGVLDVAIGERVSELSVLVAAFLRGSEESVYARDRAVSSITQLARFAVGVEYADGTKEESFPYNLTTEAFDLRDGLQVLNIFTAADKVVERVRIFDHTDRAGVALLAASARTGERVFSQFDEESWPVERFKAATQQQKPVKITVGDGTLTYGPWPSGKLDLSVMPRWSELRDLTGRDVQAASAPWLYTVSVAGTNLPPTSFVLFDSECESKICRLRYRITGWENLQFEISLTEELCFSAVLQNSGSNTIRAAITGPHVGPVKLGSAVTDDYYLFPNAGWHYHTRPVKLIARYGGRFPVQFMGVFCGERGSGMWLETRSTVGGLWDYGLQKSAAGTHLWLVHSEREIADGAALKTESTRLRFGGGDWHEAFDSYKKWAATWRKPQSQRPLWFREVFNFRQTFLHRHATLFDPATKKFDMLKAITEAQEYFGGVDYLHIFDWGSLPGVGRVYGRVGDYCPYEYLGGATAFREAIQGVRCLGIPVGLYIEGYLVAEKSKLGIKHAADWQIMDRNGSLLCYPGSTEMMMCPWGEAWRAVQAETYRQKVRDLDVDGMYLDQFGFTNPQKDCWSKAHGHPVPGSTMLAEAEMADLVRKAMESVKPGVVLYGEETPCDVAMQYQDGSFSYHMQRCRRTRPLAPVNLTRFADPTFKAFQILVCDRPLSTWSEGVEWTFFNGDGLWITGSPEWFAPATRDTIKRCHTLLRGHRDAFCSEDVEPLVPTEAGGIYANRFAVAGKTIYTLYNARHRTFQGVVLNLPMQAGARYHDGWQGIDLQPKCVKNGRVAVEMEIAPRGVSCLVITEPES